MYRLQRPMNIHFSNPNSISNMVNVDFEHRVTQKNNYRRTRARRVINFPCTDTISGLGILIM